MMAQGTAGDRAVCPAVSVVEEIGRDSALTPGELSGAARQHRDALRAAWTAYERHWARFCGARLDPQFWGLTHPARWCGVPVATDGAPFVIVGTGPSLAAGLPLLARVRSHVHIVTSPRGAEALAEAGLDADVVLIEHQTPLDAQFSVQALERGGPVWLQRLPIVATDERTPSALLLGVPADRLVVLQPLPSWGLWPATAAAVALVSGAAAVGLLGIDLGASGAPDARHRPLVDLLTLLANRTGVRCVDLGSGGAEKPGWPRGGFDDVANRRVRRPLAVDRQRWTSCRERVERAAAAWRRLVPMVDRARRALDLALRARDGHPSAHRHSGLAGVLADLLDDGCDPQTRDDVQNGLGCGFLPRYWRTPPEPSGDLPLWRPLAICAHEVVEQHRSLGARLRAEGMAL